MVPTGWPRSFRAGFIDTPSLPKFRPGGLMLTYTGNGPGQFSEIIGGWANGDVGSKPVTRAVTY